GRDPGRGDRHREVAAAPGPGRVPSEVDVMTWPTAELDPVRQLRVLAAVLPGVGLVERVLPAPFGSVWACIEDMETTVPTFDPLVTSLRIVRRDGERFVVHGRNRFVPGITRFDGELRPGWCWMQSRLYVV